MRAVMFLGVAGALCASAAEAQLVYNQPPGYSLGRTRPIAADPMRATAAPSGEYGGGFIEMLMTRGAAVQPRGGARYAEPADPLAIPVAPQARVAGLPAQPEQVVRVERTISPEFRRQEVAYAGPHRPGTVVIDTPSRHLYLVQPGGRAIRYGIGVGRRGFEWAGGTTVTRKATWPDWRPPEQMIQRRPDLPRYMAGGPDNPLGARALYLGSSLYRIHGTNEPHTIGQAVSSGCIRMMNEDVTDLYDRVGVGTRVIVI